MKSLYLQLILSSMLIPGSSYTQEPPAPEHTNFADIMLLLTANTVLHFGLAAAHEMGHIALAKLFISLGAPIAGDVLVEQNENIPSSTHFSVNSPKTSLKSDTTLSVLATYPEFKCDLLNILVVAAGPLSGAFASYAVLKTANVIVELNKNENAGSALKKGLKKPLFNEEQPQSLQGLVFTHMLLNGFALIPYRAQHGQFWSEGEKIKQSFLKRGQ